MTVRSVLLPAFVLGLAPLANLNAQEPTEAVDFGQIKPGKVIRVRTQDGPRLEGRFLRMTPETLILVSAEAERTVPIVSIDSLWVRGNAAKTGAIVGGVGLGALSFGFLAALCEGLSETGGCDEWDKVVGYGVAGAGVGALLGAGIGSAIRKWRLRYARQIKVGLAPRRHGGLAVTVSVRF